MTSRFGFVALLPSLLLCACSSGSPGKPADTGSSPDAGSGGDTGSSSLLAPPPQGQGVQLTMTTTIAASSEDERCQFVQTTADMWVNHEEVRYTPGSHHFLLWNTPYTSIPTVDNNHTTVDTTKVFDCVGGPAAAWNTTNIVAGAQSANAPPALSDLPADTALHVPAGSVLVMDLHVLNTSTSELQPTVAVNLDTIPQSQVKQEAGIYFFYDPFIRVPPNASSHARMRCPVTSDLTLTSTQTHMHKWGLGGVVNLEDSSGAVLQQLYTSTVWTDPPVTLWPAPGMAVKAGQQIDYECNYQNDGDTPVIQGLSAATNEMCVLLGAYYPRDTKFETCSTTGDWSGAASAATYVGSGTTSCKDSLTCIGSAMSSADFFGCIVDSCPGAAAPLTAAVNCFEANGSNAQSACANEELSCVGASCN